jgi:hypothetical protein
MSAAGVTTPSKKAPTRRSGKERAITPPPVFYLDAAMKVRNPVMQERILAICVQEQHDGMELARRADATAKRGQILGLISVFLVLTLAGYVATLGEAGWATAITAIDVAAIAGTFVTGQVAVRNARKREALGYKPGPSADDQ